jgi:type IV pilus assembly protein PilN
MADINLLPWRELKREREKKQFTTVLLIGIVSAALVVFLINSYAKRLIENQTYNNNLLQQEIDKYKKQIEEIKELKKLRQALIARMTIVQNLQATRSMTVRLFDELVKILPDGVYLTNVERVVNKVTLLGYAESNTNISQLMRNIESNRWIQNPELTEIKKSKEAQSSVENEFKLSFILTSPTDDSEHEYKSK